MSEPGAWRPKGWRITRWLALAAIALGAGMALVPGKHLALSEQQQAAEYP